MRVCSFLLLLLMRPRLELMFSLPSLAPVARRGGAVENEALIIANRQLEHQMMLMLQSATESREHEGAAAAATESGPMPAAALQGAVVGAPGGSGDGGGGGGDDDDGGDDEGGVWSTAVERYEQRQPGDGGLPPEFMQHITAAIKAAAGLATLSARQTGRALNSMLQASRRASFLVHRTSQLRMLPPPCPVPGARKQRPSARWPRGASALRRAFSLCKFRCSLSAHLST